MESTENGRFCKSCGLNKVLDHCKDCFVKNQVEVVRNLFEREPFDKINLEIEFVKQELENLKELFRELLIELRMKKLTKSKSGEQRK